MSDQPELARVPDPRERCRGAELQRQIETVARHPVVAGVLEASGGILAVLNEQRQVLAVNEALLQTLGLETGGDLFGLRPGEVLGCVHPSEEAGCGTTRYCSSCGAALAIVATLGTNRPAERECALSTTRQDRPFDLFFHVRCAPIVADGHRYLLLFLRDATQEQRRSGLERMFYHDVSNVIEALLAESQLLTAMTPGNSASAASVRDMAARLAAEVNLQKLLTDDSGMPRVVRPVRLDRMFRGLVALMRNHPAAEDKQLEAPAPPELELSTDRNLLERVLTNMLVNAFEATPEGGCARMTLEAGAQEALFSVWNAGEIPPEVACRVFQRNFTTKAAVGRGLGTYAMKLLGEKYLGGRVDFTTGPEGTTFRLFLPRRG